MSMVKPGTKVLCFPTFDGPSKEFLVAEHDSIAKAYLVQRCGSEPKWEDEKSIHRLLRSYPQYLLFPANELDPDDPLRLEYSRAAYSSDCNVVLPLSPSARAAPPSEAEPV